MSTQIAWPFLFVFRILSASLFLHSALSDEIFNPKFVATHFVPVVNQAGVFHPFFSIFATPTLASIIGPCVPYGHLLIGLSLLVGLMVRVSASFGVVLLMLYLLVTIQVLDLNVVGHSNVVVPIVLAYRIAIYAASIMLDTHSLYSVVLCCLIVGHAGHIWGLDAWAVKVPFLRHRFASKLTASDLTHSGESQPQPN